MFMEAHLVRRQQKASDTWAHFFFMQMISLHPGFHLFITIIILKYGAEYTRLAEARQRLNVRSRGNECIEFEWL